MRWACPVGSRVALSSLRRAFSPARGGRGPETAELRAAAIASHPRGFDGPTSSVRDHIYWHDLFRRNYLESSACIVNYLFLRVMKSYRQKMSVEFLVCCARTYSCNTTSLGSCRGGAESLMHHPSSTKAAPSLDKRGECSHTASRPYSAAAIAPVS